MSIYIDVDKLMFGRTEMIDGSVRPQITMDDIKNIHVADVRENTHGEWLGEYDGEADGTHHCSVCDGWVVWDDINYAYTYDFCPHCGAKMDGSQESEDDDADSN